LDTNTKTRTKKKVGSNNY